MLPALIAARYVFSKIGPGLARQPIQRPLVIRRNPVNQLHNGPISKQSNRRISYSRNLRQIVSKNDKTQIETCQSRPNALDDAKLGNNLENAEWIPIYRYKHIRLAALISRLKIAQTIFVVGMVPIGYHFYTKDMLTVTQLNGSMAIAGFAMIMLYFMSSIFRRCIGVVSINRNYSRIRIGYLTFWGARRNVEIPVDDVMPLSEANVALGAGKKLPPYVHVKRYSDNKFYLYLPLWKISIVDPALFEIAFGKVVSCKNK